MLVSRRYRVKAEVRAVLHATVRTRPQLQPEVISAELAKCCLRFRWCQQPHSPQSFGRSPPRSYPQQAFVRDPAEAVCPKFCLALQSAKVRDLAISSDDSGLLSFVPHWSPPSSFAAYIYPDRFRKQHREKAQPSCDEDKIEWRKAIPRCPYLRSLSDRAERTSAGGAEGNRTPDLCSAIARIPAHLTSLLEVLCL